jgi:hypothetical protein
MRDTRGRRVGQTLRVEVCYDIALNQVACDDFHYAENEYIFESPSNIIGNEVKRNLFFDV